MKKFFIFAALVIGSLSYATTTIACTFKHPWYAGERISFYQTNIAIVEYDGKTEECTWIETKWEAWKPNFSVFNCDKGGVLKLPLDRIGAGIFNGGDMSFHECRNSN